MIGIWPCPSGNFGFPQLSASIQDEPVETGPPLTVHLLGGSGPWVCELCPPHFSEGRQGHSMSNTHSLRKDPGKPDLLLKQGLPPAYKTIMTCLPENLVHFCSRTLLWLQEELWSGKAGERGSSGKISQGTIQQLLPSWDLFCICARKFVTVASTSKHSRRLLFTVSCSCLYARSLAMTWKSGIPKVWGE